MISFLSRWFAPLALIFPVSGISCVGLVGKKQTYQQSSGPHSLNGAILRLQVKPEGTESGSYAISAMVVSAAVANLDGPFRWRLVAEGQPGKHSTMKVHRLTTTTSITRRQEVFPADKVGDVVAFRRLHGNALLSRAVFSPPGLLKVKPREDGILEISADLSVTCEGHTRRRTIPFRLTPTSRTTSEWLFIPTEIIKNAGKPIDETDEASWD